MCAGELSGCQCSAVKCVPSVESLIVEGGRGKRTAVRADEALRDRGKKHARGGVSNEQGSVDTENVGIKADQAPLFSFN